MRAVGGDELVSDPRFRTNADRWENVDELDGLISAWCAARPQEEVIAQLIAHDCAAGPLETMASIGANPQVIARGSLATVPDETLGDMVMTAVAPRFLSTPMRPGPPGPTEVGAHTLQVLLDDLGLSPDDVQDLVDSGALG